MKITTASGMAVVDQSEKCPELDEAWEEINQLVIGGELTGDSNGAEIREALRRFPVEVQNTIVIDMGRVDLNGKEW